MRTCTIDGCAKKEFARGWCHMHWNRWRRNGDPDRSILIWDDDERRLLSKIDQTAGPDACWPWLGQMNYNGYGRASLRGKKRYAHAAVYEVLVGVVPDGLILDHQCHNRDRECCGGDACAHRACCNPAHVEPSTQSQNIKRARARVR